MFANNSAMIIDTTLLDIAYTLFLDMKTSSSSSSSSSSRIEILVNYGIKVKSSDKHKS